MPSRMSHARTEHAGARARRRVPRPAVPVVEFDDVTKVYDGGSVGLERVSLKVGRGEFVFLVTRSVSPSSPAVWRSR
jgi:ABC-type siderophore export system fused ATPase/permease subunit